AAGESVTSCDGRFRLTMQYDGNFVLYQGGSALWATGTWGSTGYTAIQQNDGNLVVYDVNQHALWAAGTWNHAGARLAMQNDANAVVYDTSGRALWASGTCCR